MSADALIHAIGLPHATRVDRRVPKKLLAEHGAATASDKRQVQDGVDEVQWLASLKPHLIGVPAFNASIERLRVQPLAISCAGFGSSSPLQCVACGFSSTTSK